VLVIHATDHTQSELSAVILEIHPV